MKNLISKLGVIAPFIFFPLFMLLRKRKKTAYVLIAISAFTLSSCYLNFYRTNTRSSIDASAATKLQSENKYFIIHFSNNTNGLEQVYIDGDSLHGKIVQLPEEHSGYLSPVVTNDKNRVKSIDKRNALMEVHLYTSLRLQTGGSVFSAALTSFNRADVYELNKSATTTNHILSTVGIAVTVFAIVGTIIAIAEINAAASAASSCNCPQVYVDNNGVYSFTSGLYSGAVYSSLERMDYLPLKSIPPGANSISFKISNAKNEEQFINKVELLQVNHSPETNVLADRHGNIFSYKNLQAPLSAVTDGRNDMKNVLLKTDEIYYSFDNSKNKDGFSDVTLSFYKPANTDNAKLRIHARNTYWAGLLHKEFVQLFGDGFEQWRQKQEKADPKELEKWQTDQALPLMVYIKKGDGWKFVDYFPMIGNTATRDMIMQVNVEDIPGDTIELKLETAYRFWDLDFAGIDYSADENLTTTVIEPVQVFKSDSTDQKEILHSNDKEYTHLTNEESVVFKYAAPASMENNVASYFLVSGGYYHNLEPVTGKTNYKQLYKFQHKGAFDKFSREKYKEVRDVAAIIKAKNGE
jgi:hypothetical protein